MDSHFSPDSFDITLLVENYNCQALEELFYDYRYISNDMGQFIEFTRKINDIPLDFNLLKTRKKLISNLKMVFNIGEIIEKKLKMKGINSLFDMRYNLKYSRIANEILRTIKDKNYSQLMHNRYICDLDVSFCFDLQEFLFIDIETIGIYNSPVFMIGFGYFNEDKFEIHVLFARTLEEEIALCAHMKNEVLPHFKCFISYNGKSFDIPFIANRFLYFFDENPMISSEEIPYKKSNTKYHHIDLYHSCRRLFRNDYDSYSLTSIEQNFLGFFRNNDVPSELMGECYRKYLKDPNRYGGLMKVSIEHNFYDIHSLPLIFKKLLDIY